MRRYSLYLLIALVLGTLTVLGLVRGIRHHKCDPKSGEGCSVLDPHQGLAAMELPKAPASLASFPDRLNLSVRYGKEAEVIVRDGQDRLHTLLVVPLTVSESDVAEMPALIVRLASAKGFSFSHPSFPSECRLSHLGFSHVQTGPRTGTLQINATEPKLGPHPCMKFLQNARENGFRIQFSGVPVYRDREPLRFVSITAQPLPAPVEETASRHRFRAE